jgi:putative ABC transport system permease protein
VDFHFAGVVREFPTAPSDSFVVANAAYIARATGTSAPSTFLVAARGSSPHAIAARARHVVGSDATVTDIDDSRRVVGSSLTAVNLAGLTRVELTFALVLAAAVTLLVLGVDLAERRRSYAIATALGATRRQVAAFARADALVVAVLGGGLGALGGWTLSHMLVMVLTGVFDPPPSHLAMPWSYLAVLAVTTVAGLAAATQLVVRSTAAPLAEQLRNL